MLPRRSLEIHQRFLKGQDVFIATELAWLSCCVLELGRPEEANQFLNKEVGNLAPEVSKRFHKLALSGPLARDCLGWASRER